MRTLIRLIAVVALLSGGTALARRQLHDFQPPPELTPEEREAAKARAMGGDVNAYNKDIQIEAEPVPWAAIGLAGLVLLSATPFALRAYRSAAKELDAPHASGPRVSRARR